MPKPELTTPSLAIANGGREQIGWVLQALGRGWRILVEKDQERLSDLDAVWSTIWLTGAKVLN
jgi:hypothetical protein